MGDKSINEEPAAISANLGSNRYTAINDTYLLQVVNLPTSCNLSTSGNKLVNSPSCNKHVKIRLAATPDMVSL